MTRSPKYPLDPLLEHRARVTDDATSALGGAVVAREGAERAVAAAERERREAEARANDVRDREAEMLADGRLRAVDLARAGAWEIATKASLEARDEALVQREQALAIARDAEREARDRLAAAKADHDAVAKDKDRFVDHARRVALAADDEAAEEAHAARGEGAR